MTKLVNEELKSIGYPFDDISHQKTAKKDLGDFQKLLQILDQADLPTHLKHEDDPPLPIQVLLTPLQSKFRVFFFSTSSKEFVW